jgi:fused signal recognition particle receptor
VFDFIKNAFGTIYKQFTAKIGSFFARTVIDEAALVQLETILLAGDVGAKSTRLIMEQLRAKQITDGALLHKAMSEILYAMLTVTPCVHVAQSRIFLMVGVNGSGKTTTTGKLAHWWAKQGKKVLVVAADTFRAAAVEQLHEWAKITGVEMFTGAQGAEPAAVVFGGCQRFIDGGFDILIIDTAGRLQTKTHLMLELGKIRKVIVKKMGDMPICTLLTIDSMLGQNSFDQAKIFKQVTDVSGIVLTKMDGTGKGGILFSIVADLGIPVLYVTCGEKVEDIALFDARIYVDDLLQKV